jgi:N-terminal domain of toast_rack, DUF2154
MRLLRCVEVTLLTAAALTAGCNAVPAGETKTVNTTLDRGKAEAVAVSLEMNAGELKVDGGSPKLMDASFRFNVPEWEPKVQYADDASRATLSVKQTGPTTTTGKAENTWTVHLSDDVPIDLSATLGAGDATLTIGTMNLQRVDVKQGAGDLSVDLRGEPKRSYDVAVKAGAGDTKVHLPRNVGIVATAIKAIGDLHVDGLQKRGSTWINPEHENDPVVIHLDVKGGVGDISISTE